MYKSVGGACSPGRMRIFGSLITPVFGILALMFALLQMLSLPNLKAIFGDPLPFTHHIFSAGPPLKPYFLACPPPHLIKNERSLNWSKFKVVYLFVYLFIYLFKVPLRRKFVGLFSPNSVAEYRVVYIFTQITEQETFHPNIF